MDKKNKKPKLICYCNGIPREEVCQAIERGCNTLGKIFDATTAGVGACGGSCQPEIKHLLESYKTLAKKKA